MTKFDPNDETQRMAIMAWREEEKKLIESGELFRLTGICQAYDLIEAEAHVLKILALKKIHDGGRYKPFGSWERYCDLIGKNHRSLLEEFQTLQTLGADLLQRAAALDLPRETIRQIRALNQPAMKDLEAKMTGDLSAKEAKEIVRQALDLAAQDRADLKAKTEDLKKSANRFEEEANSAREELKDTKKQIADLEHRLAAAQKKVPADARYVVLYATVMRSLNELKAYVQHAGIKKEDGRKFLDDCDRMRDVIQETICIHHGEKRVGESREQAIERMMKEEEITREEAEAALDAMTGEDEKEA